MLRSVFASQADFFATINQLKDATALKTKRFSARNFALECSLPIARVQKYMSRPDMPRPQADEEDTLEEFNYYHNNYVSENLRSGLRLNLFDERDSNCPDSFRPGRRLNEYGGSGDELLLVRLEEVDFIARQALEDPNDVFNMLNEVSDGVRDETLSRSLADSCTRLLERWQMRVDNRPLFSAFWEETRGVAENPKVGWADELRDKLGLAHIDPAQRGIGGEIRVVLFRYPIRIVPRSASGMKLLVRPSVLDGTLNDAFYTAPGGSGAGATVDLQVRNGQPWQEVIHPAVQFRSEHVWAVDKIRAPIPDISSARGFHCHKICSGAPSDFTQLCEEIDGDLL
jgi:hypothetical protein